MLNKIKMLRKNISIILCLLSFCFIRVNAQEIWSLEKCINYAFENNISIKRQEINTQLYKSQLEQSKLNRLPDLNAQSSYGYSFGFTWLQEQGQNVDVNTRSLSMGIGTSVNV